MQEIKDRTYYERSLKEKGYHFVAGVDEAGRGPCAGPIFAAAVILDEQNPILELKDSKKLTEKKRLYLFEEIKRKAKAYAVVSVSASEINQMGIGVANVYAMEESVRQLPISPDFALVDFIKLDEKRIPCSYLAFAKADDLSESVAAASILAKVSRDQYMIELEKSFPQYRFSKHKGYGTALHKAEILEYGMTSEHRTQFVHTLLKKERNV